MEELTTTITIPRRIAQQVEDQVKQGWFTDLNSLVIEALRRYLETRSAEISEKWILHDLEWGLSGEE